MSVFLSCSVGNSENTIGFIHLFGCGGAVVGFIIGGQGFFSPQDPSIVRSAKRVEKLLFDESN